MIYKVLLSLALSYYISAFYWSGNLDHFILVDFFLLFVFFGGTGVLGVLFIRLLSRLLKLPLVTEDKLFGAFFASTIVLYLRQASFANILPALQNFLWPARIVQILTIFLAAGIGYWGGGQLRKRPLSFIAILLLMAALPTFKVLQGGQFFSKSMEAENFARQFSKEPFLAFKASSKKNVYFILLDSYGNRNTLTQLGIKNDDFYTVLRQKGFHLYHEFYTTSQATAWAMPTYFNMENHFYRSAPDAFQISGGFNKLHYIFERYGYKFNLVHDHVYLQQFGCFADVCYPSAANSTEYKPLLNPRVAYLINRTFLLDKVNSPFLKKILGVGNALAIDNRNIPSAMPKIMEETVLQSKTPHFTYIHLTSTPGHAPCGKSCNAPQQANSYKTRVYRANSMGLELINLIGKYDPEAIIIIAGDHGPFIEDQCKGPILSKNASCRLIFENANALCAIKWGKEYKGEYDNSIRSSVSLFRYVLAYVSQNPEHLKLANEDIALALGEDFPASVYTTIEANGACAAPLKRAHQEQK
jgi:hypothetical protein